MLENVGIASPPIDRQTFLLALSDRIRKHSDPLAVMHAALEMIGQHLGVNRVGYCDVEDTDDTMFFPTGWGDGVLKPITGRVPLSPFGDAIVGDLRSGHTVVISDTYLHTSVPSGVFEAVGVRAMVCVPLIRDSAWVSAIFANHATVRAWRSDEVQLLADVLERTWDAVERARAEAGRRRSEQQQALLFDLIFQQRQASNEQVVLKAAAQAIGRHLQTDRTGFFELPDDDTVVFANCWTAGSLPALEGPFPAVGIGAAALVQIRGGETIMFTNAETDSIVAGSVFPEIETLAGIGAPIVRDGRWQAGLYVNNREPRLWRVDEVELVQEVAGLTWDAIERLRAQAGLTERTLERDRAWSLARELLVIARPDGTLEAVNPIWTEVLGWEEHELLGQPFIAFTHPDDLDATVTVFDSIFREPLTTPYEYRFRHRDGSYRWIGWTSVFEGGRVFASGRDVTANKEQAIALRQSEARASVYFDFSNDYLFLVRVATNGAVCFEDMNPACEAVMGLVRADVIGHSIDAFVPENSASDIAKYARLCLKTFQPQAYLAEREYQNGRKTYIEGRVTFVEGTGEGGLVLFSGTDVTDRRRIEEALRQSQKMEAVGQLTGGLAHDFNNLLAGISGSLELMQSRMQQGRLTDVDRYMTAAQGAAKRAAALTHRLLAFSRRQTLDPKPTDVNRLAIGMQELIQRTVGPAIPVEIVGVASVWPALVDPSQLENALLNLCINARDAMPEGGRITVETANKWMDERAARQHDMPEGQYLALSVTDTGTGMPPEVVARVFEPFFTTKPIGEGTGLGLSMIYGFAQQSGGQVRIYSEVGLGTTVTIYLPRHYGEVVDDDADAVVAALPRSEQGETVLVVDDEPTVRMLVTDILEDLGYTSIEAGDSAAGLKVLQSDVRINLLITDVGLPGGMNGRQMADAARNHRPNLKVLFITGYAENAILGAGKLPPGMAVLTKPFAMDTMAARIRSMVECSKEQARRG